MRNIQQVLERWGGWAAQDNTAVSWAPVAAGFKGLVIPDPSCSRPSCSDDDGLIIDSCVCRLQKVRHTGELDLIMAHYVYGASKRTLARQQGVNEKAIRIRLQVAEGFIDGCLSMLNVRLDMDPEVVEFGLKKVLVRSAKSALAC
ncbi:antiterminator Q family protein [Klebsiella variicola]|uniref:antiterminator Q family protein n=1 Tax=Klebsiella variicola TaxID=244366 RepID=UPI002168B148|nr:antiterminator Q family protein [Klebsiella variicola]MCS4333685.1 antitermination protein Q [Klebsiella variicola subsp. variicola]